MSQLRIAVGTAVGGDAPHAIFGDVVAITYSVPRTEAGQEADARRPCDRRHRGRGRPARRPRGATTPRRHPEHRRNPLGHAEATSPEAGGYCHPATWADLVEISRRTEEEDRRVIAWSTHESDNLAAHAPNISDRSWFSENIVNAIPLARKWKRKVFPDVVFAVDPKDRTRGRDQLHRYFELIDYPVPKGLGPGNSAQRIRYVREMLGRKRGDYSALTPTAKAKWTKALRQNWHDCNGLRDLAVRCLTDLG